MSLSMATKSWAEMSAFAVTDGFSSAPADVAQLLSRAVAAALAAARAAILAIEGAPLPLQHALRSRMFHSDKGFWHGAAELLEQRRIEEAASQAALMAKTETATSGRQEGSCFRAWHLAS